jgi:hypothetical protein
MAIQITREDGDTSGRFGVARMIARVFPAHKAFVTRVIEEDRAGRLQSGPYPRDKLAYKNNEIVEYQTPAQTDGLGTNSRLQKNRNPIRGSAILVGNAPDLQFLAICLSPELSGLASAIIRRAERDAADDDHGGR